MNGIQTQNDNIIGSILENLRYKIEEALNIKLDDKDLWYTHWGAYKCVWLMKDNEYFLHHPKDVVRCGDVVINNNESQYVIRISDPKYLIRIKEAHDAAS